MTADPVVTPSANAAFAVTPVVDYEPPTHDVARSRSGQPLHAPLRRRGGRSSAGQPGRRPAGPAAQVSTVLSAPMRQAAVFADAALRRVLEVIDRRRPAAQLRGLLVPSLVDSVVSVSRSAGGHACGQQGAAVLRRVRLQPAGDREPQTAAEVFGSYSRGDRVHAIACRVERVPGDSGNRWLVVALHIG